MASGDGVVRCQTNKDGGDVRTSVTFASPGGPLSSLPHLMLFQENSFHTKLLDLFI